VAFFVSMESGGSAVLLLNTQEEGALHAVLEGRQAPQDMTLLHSVYQRLNQRRDERTRMDARAAATRQRDTVS
jgi:hypothetical protein